MKVFRAGGFAASKRRRHPAGNCSMSPKHPWPSGPCAPSRRNARHPGARCPAPGGAPLASLWAGSAGGFREKGLDIARVDTTARCAQCQRSLQLEFSLRKLHLLHYAVANVFAAKIGVLGAMEQPTLGVQASMPPRCWMPFEPTPHADARAASEAVQRLRGWPAAQRVAGSVRAHSAGTVLACCRFSRFLRPLRVVVRHDHYRHHQETGHD